MLYTYNEEFAAVLLVSTFICFIEFSYLYGLLLLYLFHSFELKVCTSSPVSSLYTFISPSFPSIESAFVNAGIPHRIIGGLRFYDREEIKNTLSYLSLILDHEDDASLERIINVPSRKIGKVTLSKIKTVASQQGVSLFDACMLYCKANKKSLGIKNFVDFILRAGNEFDEKSRTIAVMLYEGYKQNEIAEYLGMSPAAVNKMMKKMRQSLKKFL